MRRSRWCACGAHAPEAAERDVGDCAPRSARYRRRGDRHRYFAFHLVDYLPRLWLPTVGASSVAAYVLSLRRLGRAIEPDCAAAVAFDGLMIARGILLFHDPGGLMARFDPELYRILAGGTITRADVEAVTPPMLVLLALTGGFRLDFRLAVFSTAIALLVFAHFRLVFPAPPQQTGSLRRHLVRRCARCQRGPCVPLDRAQGGQERLLNKHPTALTQRSCVRATRTGRDGSKRSPSSSPTFGDSRASPNRSALWRRSTC